MHIEPLPPLLPPAVSELVLTTEHLRFLQSLKTWPVFGKGWRRRLAQVKSAALVVAAKASVPVSVGNRNNAREAR